MMKAGFARAAITPPPETTMMGWGARDRDHGCEGAHDELYVRALYAVDDGDDGEEALLLGFDLCFLDRELADRLRGALGRRLDLAPRRILLNASHTHSGPATHRWAYGDFDGPDLLYLRRLEAATLAAAIEAREAARPVKLRAGMARTALPLSRRRKTDGRVAFAPAPGEEVCRALPLCLFADDAGEPVCLLFSVACHPSTAWGFEVSADYPGVAMNRIDAHLGAPAALFLQGAGGDAKARVIGDRPDGWRRGTWADVDAAGAMVADEVIAALAGLDDVAPLLRACETEMVWPLTAVPARDAYEEIADAPETPELRRLWAERQAKLLDRGEALATSAVVTAHGVQLARGVRLVGIEGEPVAALGNQILDFYAGGVTFALGYTDGCALYLPTSAMIDEGGYEVSSFWEYGYPAPLARGMEAILTRALKQLREDGIR